jgi:hypothetical protein
MTSESDDKRVQGDEKEVAETEGNACQGAAEFAKDNTKNFATPRIRVTNFATSFRANKPKARHMRGCRYHAVSHMTLSGDEMHIGQSKSVICRTTERSRGKT